MYVGTGIENGVVTAYRSSSSMYAPLTAHSHDATRSDDGEVSLHTYST